MDSISALGGLSIAGVDEIVAAIALCLATDSNGFDASVSSHAKLAWSISPDIVALTRRR